jgi:DNA-binding PadR family transcriptional regulator
MPRRSHQLSAADYAILGLLMMGPRHGYELAPHFTRDGDLGLVCTLGLPRLYALLHALEELELVTCEGSVISGGPPRKVYHLTDSGQETFRRWAEQPIRRLRQIRQDFLLKLYFSRTLSNHDTGQLIDGQIQACRAVSEELAAAAAAEPADSFAAMVFHSRQVTADATIAWLESEHARAGEQVGQTDVPPPKAARSPG